MQRSATLDAAITSPAPFDPLLLSSSPLPSPLSLSPPSPAPSQPFHTTKNFSRILVLVAAALYGTNFACVKILDTHVDIAAGAAIRFGLAALATSPFLFTNIGQQPPSSSSSPKTSTSENLKVIAAGLEVGVWNSAGYLAQALGLETTSACKSAFICSLAVVVVPLLDFAFGGKKLTTTTAIGCALAMVGVGVLEMPTDFDFTAIGSHPFSLPTLSPGEIATYLQPLTFGVGFWRMESAMRSHPTSALRLTASQLLAVASVANIYMLSSGGGVPPPTLEVVEGWMRDPEIAGSLVWTGLFTTALTVWLETVAMKNLSASETTMLFSTEPVWGSLFASVVMGEVFGVNGAVGAAVILGACVYSSGGFDGMMSKDKGWEEDSPPKALLANPAVVGGGVVATGVVSDLQANIEPMVEGVEEAVEKLGDIVTDGVVGAVDVVEILGDKVM